MRLLIIISLLASFLAACATTERTMAGKIGCPDDEINIFDKNPGWGITPTTWRASCRGENFVCSLAPGRNDLNDMSCSPEVGQASSFDPLGG